MPVKGNKNCRLAYVEQLASGNTTTPWSIIYRNWIENKQVSDFDFDYIVRHWYIVLLTAAIQFIKSFIHESGGTFVHEVALVLGQNLVSRS